MVKQLNSHFVAAIAVLFAIGSVMSQDSNDDAPFVRPSKEDLVGYRDSQRISVRLLNRFHLAVIGRLIQKLPSELGLEMQYNGIVSVDNGRDKSLRVCGSFGDPLSWYIIDKNGSIVFSIDITPEKRPSTDVVCRMGKQTVFVNVTHTPGHLDPSKKELDKKRKELGGRSVAEVVKLLESPPSEIELPFPLDLEEFKKLIKKEKERKE